MGTRKEDCSRATGKSFSPSGFGIESHTSSKAQIRMGGPAVMCLSDYCRLETDNGMEKLEIVLLRRGNKGV
jgi:hypothetical protein